MAIRAGSGIAFLGGVVNWLINDPRWLNSEFHRTYVQNYTNIATLIDGNFKDTEDLEGAFSGLSEDAKSYSGKTRQYQHDASCTAPKTVYTFEQLLRDFFGLLLTPFLLVLVRGQVTQT